MIGGVQQKILVHQDENGNLKIDDEMGKLLFGDPNTHMKYKLVRERDGLTHHAREIGWIEWNENGTFKEQFDDIAVGRSLILEPHRLSYTWLTTTVTEIIEQQDDYIKFNTNNSVYELFRIIPNEK
jgi:3-phenylpropionate/cinnamic acid dioxygenase small subunit